MILGFNFEGESDSSRAVAREFPEVEQLRAPVQLGYCRAYNQLMARGTGRYFLLIDDDTVLGVRSIEGMVRFMDEHPDVGIAGCRTTNRDGSLPKEHGQDVHAGNGIRQCLSAESLLERRHRRDRQVLEAGRLAERPLSHRARCCFRSRSAVSDEFYYTIQSEPDWCLRIWQAGWEVAYVPEVEVMHIGGEHSVATTVKSRANIIRVHVNRYYFIRKHYGAASMHLLRVIMSTAAMLRLLKYIVLWLVSARHRPEAGPKIAAYWQVVLMGAARHPDRLPDDLERLYANFASFGPGA